MIVFGGFDLMGIFGKRVWQVNFRFFGIFAYLYPLVLVYFGYLLHQKKGSKIRRVEVGVSSVLLFLLLLVLQYVFIHYGAIGEAIVDVLKPYLGNFGIISTSLLLVLFCTLSLRDEDLFLYFKKINLSQIKSYIHNSLHIFKTKIASPLKALIQNRYAKLTAPKEKIPTPSIDLEIAQEEFANKEEKTLNLSLPTPIQNKEEDLPNHQNFNDTNYKEEEIKIQEYIVTKHKPQRSQNIKIIETNEAQPSKEPNPFSREELLSLGGQKVSSSAELLQKIRSRHQTPQPSVSAPIPQPTPTSSRPTSTKKEMPKILQSTPLDTPKAQNISQAQKEEHIPSLEEIHPLQQEELYKELQEQMQEEILQESARMESYEEENEIEEFETFTEEIEEEFAIQENHDLESQLIEPSTPSTPSHLQESIPQTPQPQREITPYPSSPFFNTRTPKVSSLAENEALLNEIDKGEREAPKDYALPPLSLLSPAPEQESTEFDEGEIDQKIENLLEKLSVFKIDGDVTRTYSGPIITTLEFRPAPNVKVSRIQSLENDIAMALEAKSIRIQAPIPGKSVVGIEIPNTTIQTIYLREIFESEIFKNSASPLTLALGKDVVGNPFVTDLKKLPHLLIAGTTGSGKSVGVNAMILSLLYRNSPEDLKLMMVDPKMVEFMPYTDLPHLITPIITDPKKAVIGLANAVKEMERRYTLMSQSRTKEIVSYNQKAQELGLEKFPYFVIIIDELADLMMTAGKEVEYSMARIAQMGRASGMHLIVATQSPRAEVLTGLIKTNLPAHLSYKVGTKIDASIIGCPGAETLLGRGDMLFTPPGVSGLVRLHAPWSSEDEVNEIVSYIKEQREVMYDPLFSPEERESLGAMDNAELDSESAELIDRAKEVILQDGKTSISYIQRRLGIGYNKAADVMEKLEQMGFVSAPNSKGAREVLG